MNYGGKSMQKNTIICLVLIILLGCSTILFLTSDYSNEKNITGSEAITTGYKFTLKEYCGKVAVFNYGADTPLEILNCPLSSLPEDAVLQPVSYTHLTLPTMAVV